VERGEPSIEKVREWCLENLYLQGCCLRLYRLRTVGLAPVSKYWTYRLHADVMDPVNWCSCVTTWLKTLSPLLQGYREGGRMRWPKMTARPICLRSPRLLPGVGTCFILVGTNERLPTRTTRDVWFGTIRKSSMKNVWHVDPIFPCRVYINSNRRDSQIWVSLVCGSHHVCNLMGNCLLMN
jgi:hypothetical protein